LSAARRRCRASGRAGARRPWRAVLLAGLQATAWAVPVLPALW
jgi:hypothetical protein